MVLKIFTIKLPNQKILQEKTLLTDWKVVSIGYLLRFYLCLQYFCCLANSIPLLLKTEKKHLKTAIWLFPLYLLIFNFFVFPIAWGGKILFQGENVNPELYSILIPQKFGNILIAVMVFLGGLSASISMIIISSITLSVMLSNNVIIPYGWIDTFKEKSENFNTKNIVNIRKISIFSLIIQHIFYKYLIVQSSLFSVGLVSFVLIAQLGPAFLLLFSGKRHVQWRSNRHFGRDFHLLFNLIIPQYIQAIDPDFISNKNQFLNFSESPIYQPFHRFLLEYSGKLFTFCNHFCKF